MKFRFVNRDGVELSGVLELSANQRSSYALFGHCFTCSKQSKAAVAVSRALAAKGVSVLRFDFTGIGESEGDFSETDLQQYLGSH